MIKLIKIIKIIKTIIKNWKIIIIKWKTIDKDENNMLLEWIEGTDKESLEEVRMFTLLIIIKLIRANIMHFVSWNVDPRSIGFDNKNNDELGEVIKNSLTIPERYVNFIKSFSIW